MIYPNVFLSCLCTPHRLKVFWLVFCFSVFSNQVFSVNAVPPPTCSDRVYTRPVTREYDLTRESACYESRAVAVRRFNLDRHEKLDCPSTCSEGALTEHVDETIKFDDTNEVLYSCTAEGRFRVECNGQPPSLLSYPYRGEKTTRDWANCIDIAKERATIQAYEYAQTQCPEDHPAILPSTNSWTTSGPDIVTSTSKSWCEAEVITYTQHCGTLIEGDADGDGVADETDNAPNHYNPDQADLDGDGIPDVIDTDVDGDGVLDKDDPYPTDPSRWKSIGLLLLLSQLGLVRRSKRVKKDVL